MKRLFLVLLVSLAVLTAHDSNITSADEGDGIPLSKLAGKYAITNQGSITICFKPDFSATEACSTPGVVAFPGNTVSVGESAQDKSGNWCQTFTNTFSFPGDTFPTTGTVGHSVAKVTSYDPATGSGDYTFTAYMGGKCVGSKFDSTGATLSGTGTVHFVASDGGKRIDEVVTTDTDPVGDFGAFNLSGFEIKQ